MSGWGAGGRRQPPRSSRGHKEGGAWGGAAGPHLHDTGDAAAAAGAGPGVGAELGAVHLSDGGANAVLGLRGWKKAIKQAMEGSVVRGPEHAGWGRADGRRALLLSSSSLSGAVLRGLGAAALPQLQAAQPSGAVAAHLADHLLEADAHGVRGLDVGAGEGGRDIRHKGLGLPDGINGGLQGGAGREGVGGVGGGVRRGRMGRALKHGGAGARRRARRPARRAGEACGVGGGWAGGVAGGVGAGGRAHEAQGRLSTRDCMWIGRGRRPGRAGATHPGDGDGGVEHRGIALQLAAAGGLAELQGGGQGQQGVRGKARRRRGKAPGVDNRVDNMGASCRPRRPAITHHRAAGH